MQGFAQPEDRFPSAHDEGDHPDPGPAARVAENAGESGLGETELDSALQLLVERAQYITGATGAALALPQGEEMVCRASAGSSAPAVGASLQVRSGLTGESIARRQLLRCDNAETDARVNLEACRALGIASIVVLPLLRGNGDVRGLFELFSDHPYAFEERDLVALERMADLTMTALDLSERRQSSSPARVLRGVMPAEAIPAGTTKDAEKTDAQAVSPPPVEVPPPPQWMEPPAVRAEPVAASPAAPVVEAPAPASEPPPAPVAAPELVGAAAPAEPEAAAAIPESMLRVQKCSSCGFPVSEGRTLCLDCENKAQAREALARKQSAEETKVTLDSTTGAPVESPVELPVELKEEFIPAFLANATPPSESWLADHVNLLAMIVFLVGIVVAIVVFR